jgi:hypothetical protein
MLERTTTASQPIARVGVTTLEPAPFSLGGSTLTGSAVVLPGERVSSLAVQSVGSVLVQPANGSHILEPAPSESDSPGARRR